MHDTSKYKNTLQAPRSSQHPTTLRSPMANTLIVSMTLLLTLTLTLTESKHTPAVAPGPTPPPLNLTAILEKGGQYTTLIRLLNSTQVLSQIQSQLNNSFNGLTILAPTDNAFSNLKPGTLNGLTSQEQVALVLYHVLPRYYSLSTFQTASNPVSTQASSSGGVYTVNVTSSSRQVNVSTGVNEAVVENELYQDFPLAVYSIEEVLLPYDIFGAKPPAEAPSPAEGKTKEAKKVPSAKAPSAAAAAAEDNAGSATASSTKSGGSGLKMKSLMDWGFGAGVALVFVGFVL